MLPRSDAQDHRGRGRGAGPFLSSSLSLHLDFITHIWVLMGSWALTVGRVFLFLSVLKLEESLQRLRSNCSGHNLVFAIASVPLIDCIPPQADTCGTKQGRQRQGQPGWDIMFM